MAECLQIWQLDVFNTEIWNGQILIICFNLICDGSKIEMCPYFIFVVVVAAFTRMW